MKKFIAAICIFVSLSLPFGAAFADSLVSVENADFLSLDKDGFPADWYTEAWYAEEGDFLVSREVDEVGESCIHIVNYCENDVRFCQSVPVEAEGYYRIECDVLYPESDEGAGANVSVAGTFAISEPLSGSPDWQHVELVGQTAEDAEEMIVCMRLGGYSALSKGEAWFKNFSVTKLDTAPAGEVQSFFIAPTDVQEVEVEKYNAVAILLAAFATALAGLYCFKRYILPKGRPEIEEKRDDSAIIFILALAFSLRGMLSLLFYGYPTDINCFMGWASAAAENGLSNFYTSGMFSDYPPGYIYILWLLGKLIRLLGISYGGAACVLLIKMPSILADLLAAYIAYRMAVKNCPKSGALTIAAFVALNPVTAFVSGGWGQVDQIWTLLLLLALYFFMQDNLELCGVVYGIAIITKPQALMAGPLLAAAYFAKIKDNGIKYLWRTAVSVVGAVVSIFILSLPFKGNQEPLWFMDKLLGTATSYPYASVDAFNVQALLGGNWMHVDTPFMGLTYGTWGSIMIGISCIGGILLHVKTREKQGSLVLSLAVVLGGIFAFGQYMHERYVFPVLMLILWAFLLIKDRRLIIAFVIYTCAALLNILAVFDVAEAAHLRGNAFELTQTVSAVLNLAGLVLLAYSAEEILVKDRLLPAFEGVVNASEEDAFDALPVIERETQGEFTKQDRLWCFVLTAVYAVVALLNLGTTQAPETYWTGISGDSAVIEFGSEQQIGEIRVFGGLYEGEIIFTANGEEITAYSQTNDDMFRWTAIYEGELKTDSVTLTVDYGKAWFNEIAFFDVKGNLIKAESPAAPQLTDEPDMVPQTPSYLNGMYFDELYHGRTAYEHLNGIDPYENSHPPLGKIFIMLGIAVFGMNAFGWRIAGTLFGIVMVPIMYAFGKRLFKKSEYALLAAGLFAFDFMHFTQTRIATIDVYGVFFIILMYYFMYRYYCMNFYVDGLKNTLKPLAWAGVCFGLGAASKWICIYAGAGLAVIFFTSLFKRYDEYISLKDDNREGAKVACFPRYAVITLLWCCLFYILVPVIIYIASYIPYMLCEKGYGLKDVWGYQEFMFTYHSGLTATHPYQSAWWQWPINARPVWYYISYDVPAGYTSTISAFGNPAVWWVCSLGAIVFIVRWLLGKINKEGGMFVLLIGIAANYLPWVLVPRCTFAYHYFATVPFIILATVYLVRELDEKKPQLSCAKWVWLGAAVVLFALFYPVISGSVVNKALVKALEWLPGWTFMGY